MIEFIDTNCQIGKRKKPINEILRTPKHVEGVMDRCGISRAIVYHAVAEEDDLWKGNMKLISEIERKDRFMPQWLVRPEVSEGDPDSSEIIAKMKANDVKSVRIVPPTQDPSGNQNAFRDLITALCECKIPIFINRPQFGFDGIQELCSTYPDATFVVCTAGYGAMSRYSSLLEAFKNLRIETGNFMDHDGIKIVCSDFGAEKLIFGTCSPMMTTSAEAVSHIMYSGISDEEKQLIASGNILRLLEEVSL